MGVVATGLAGQDAPQSAGGVGWLGARDDRFRERFQQLLLSAHPDLHAGWQLAADIGRPAAPLLWELLRAETSYVPRRLALLAAAVIAGGPSEDERLFRWLDQAKDMPWERVFAAELLALGPQRQRPVTGFWTRCLGPTKSPDEILSIAVRLAAARFPGTELGAPVLTSDDADPGLAAATAYAGLPVPAVLANRLWNLRSPERHAELFWRGALLAGARARADGTAPQDGLLERAVEVLRLTGEANRSANAAAALFRLRANDWRSEGMRPEWRLLQLAAAESQGAQSLRSWLGPVPGPRDDEAPQRLAVCYVLSRPPAAVVKDRALWGSDARIARHVAVALAWRLLGEQAPMEVGQLPNSVPEWCFVRWAAGAQVDRAAELEDAPLKAAAYLMAEGRLPRAALRTLLEDTLWRWGSHPGLGMWENEHLLLRDLLLVGSNQGGGKYMPQIEPERRYLPRGIAPDHDFFDVAIALYEFLGRPRLPRPPEYRLR